MCMCTLDGLPELGCLQICRPHMLKHLDKFCDAIATAHKIFSSKKSLNSCCHVAFQTEMYDTLLFVHGVDHLGMQNSLMMISQQ